MCRPSAGMTGSNAPPTLSAASVRIPRNSRRRRSSASIETFVSSSPFHQPPRAAGPRVRRQPSEAPRRRRRRGGRGGRRGRPARPARRAARSPLGRRPAHPPARRSRRHVAGDAASSARGGAHRAPVERGQRGEQVCLAIAIVSPGAALVEQPCRLVDVRVAEPALEQGLEALRQPCAPGEHDHDRQGLLVLAEVVADRLARDGRLAPDAEHVVDRLEGDADVPAELRQRVHGRSRGAGEDRSEGGGAGEQGAVLPASMVQTVLDRQRGPLLEGHVLRLAGDHRLRGLDEHGPPPAHARASARRGGSAGRAWRGRRRR